MKHYISIEDNQIIYVSGSFAAGRYRIDKADRMILPAENREQAVRAFAARNRLSGKTVILALDSGIFFSVLSMPKAKPAQLREMVRNELTHSIGKGEPLVVCSLPYRENTDGTSMTVLTFAILEKYFHQQVELLLQAGIRCRKAYVLSNCMGHLAAKVFPDKKTMILVEAGEEHLRLLLIENGYCLLARNVRLNVRHFCETGAFGLLYDEISEQVSKAIQFHKSRNKSDEVELLALYSDVLPNNQGAAKAIGMNLGISCEEAVLPLDLRSGLDPHQVKHCHGAIAVMSKDYSRKAREVELLSAEWNARSSEGRNNGWNLVFRTGTLFLASALVLVGTTVFLKTRNYFARTNIQDLITYLEYAGRQDGYRLAVEQLKQVEELREHSRLVREYEAEIRIGNRFSNADYQIFTDAAVGATQIKGIRYLGETGVCEIDVWADNPQVFAALVKRVRETGHFTGVSYDYWEYVEHSDQEYYYAVTIFAEHGEGEWHEAE